MFQLCAYRFITEFARARGWAEGDWKAVMSRRKSFEYYEASRGIGLGWWNISPPSRAGYRNYLNDATSSWLPLPATFWASVVRAMLRGQCRRMVSRRPSDACQPTLVEAPSRMCDKAWLATIKKVGPSHIPVFYSMTRQSRVPARRASAAAHDTVWSLRLLRRGRGPLQFR